MAARHYMDLLRARFAQGKAVCVGLDPDISKMAKKWHRAGKAGDIEDTLYDFCVSIVNDTADIVCAFKPNIAAFEAYGAAGLAALRRIIRYIHEVAPGVPVILDAKRGDIDNTNLGYVRSAFDDFKADAVTVHPYLGGKALKPFLDRADKGIIVLCHTSNEGADEFQGDQVLLRDPEEQAFHETVGHMSYPGGGKQGAVELYRRVAYRVARHWNKHGNCGLVVGATYPEEVGQVRQIAPDMPFLIPGIGAQGGDLEATVKNGRDSKGQGIIVNSSRVIIYADVPRVEALKLDASIRQFATA